VRGDTVGGILTVPSRRHLSRSFPEASRPCLRHQRGVIKSYLRERGQRPHFLVRRALVGELACAMATRRLGPSTNHLMGALGDKIQSAVCDDWTSKGAGESAGHHHRRGGVARGQIAPRTGRLPCAHRVDADDSSNRHADAQHDWALNSNRTNYEPGCQGCAGRFTTELRQER
jgi:hypothetical protein